MLAPPPAQENGLSNPLKKAITEQVDRMLASPFFNHSKRLPNFLRFVVTHTLAGEVEKIKERTLGVEVFGREAGYDTASDPIVRVTAAELRKRVAQYYQETAHDEELRITLAPGSYIPQFCSPEGRILHDPPARDPVAVEIPEPTVPPLLRAKHAWLLLVTIGSAAAALLLGAAIFLWAPANQTAFDYFWSPVLGAHEPILLCVADQTQYSVIALRDSFDTSRQTLLKDTLTAVVIDDLDATVKVAGVLQSSRKQYTVKGENATGLEDLRRGPAIFVGAFDNAWTLRLTNPLRYHFANDADMTHLWIMDGTAPGRSRWTVDRGVQMATNNYRDYGLIARFTDGNTGKVEVVIAGIGRGGTRAAGEFVTDNASLSQLRRAARAAGDKKNMEVVLSTEIIDGEPGTPRVEATYFW